MSKIISKEARQVQALRRHYGDKINHFTDDQVFRAWEKFIGSSEIHDLLLWMIKIKKEDEIDQAKLLQKKV